MSILLDFLSSSLISRLSFRNIKQEAFSQSSLARSFVIVSPATENTLSDGAEVPGMQRIFLLSWTMLESFFHDSSTEIMNRYIYPSLHSLEFLSFQFSVVPR